MKDLMNRRAVVRILVLCAALAVWMSAAAAAPAHAAAPRFHPIVPSDRTFKADQVEHLGYAPRIVFFGGSRAMRFEPKYAQAKTGLKGYNASFIGSKPEDVWAFVHFLRARSPGTTLHVFWGIQDNTFSDNKHLDPALLQDKRLARYIPWSLRKTQFKYLPDSYAELPYNSMLNRKYLRDGMVVWDNYDRRAQQGYTLAQSLKKYIANLLKHHHGTSPGHPTRARKYFEWTLSYLTKQHCRVLLVLLPIHPKVLKVIANDNWRAAHQNLLDYLTGLQAKYSFSYLDFTQIASFGGDPQAFYDGVHFKVKNARRIIDTAVKQAPEVFK